MLIMAVITALNPRERLEVCNWWKIITKYKHPDVIYWIGLALTVGLEFVTFFFQGNYIGGRNYLYI